MKRELAIGPRLALLLWACAVTATGCDVGNPAGTGDPSGTGATAEVVLTTGNSTVQDGGAFDTPLDNGTSTVALFSEHKDIWTLRNHTAAAIVVDSVTVEVGAGVQAEEFGLYDNAIPSKPTTIAGVTVEAGKTLEFQVRFFPVSGGERKAKVTVAYDGGKKLAFDLTGRGQTEARFFSKGTVAWERLLGGVKSDELTGAAAQTADGTTCVSANASELTDGFSTDVVFTCVDATGALKWSKVWNGPNQDRAPDSGQNGETGGTAGSLVVGADGMLYGVIAVSPVKQNNQFVAMVVKIDPADGTLVWAQGVKPVAEYKTASHNAAPYAIDASGPRVWIVGTTEGDAKLMLAALSPADGTLETFQAIEIHKAVNDRAFAIRRDGKGGAYVGGRGNDGAFVLRLTHVDAGTPEVAWTRTLDLGKASVNAIDVDAEGNGYLALDVRGATTFLGVAKIDTTGKLGWTKTWQGNKTGDKQNSHVVRVFGDVVVLAGRTGPDNFDGQMGDAFVAAVSTADGATQWSSFHFSGKGPDELCEHRVKGVLLAGKSLTLVSQAYSGKDNGERYVGYWYDGLEAAGDLTLVSQDATATLEAVATAVTVPGDTLGKWLEAPPTWLVQPAKDKHDGKSPDADVLVTRIELL